MRMVTMWSYVGTPVGADTAIEEEIPVIELFAASVAVIV